MPMLGDLLATARDSAGGFPAWLESTDPGVARRVDAAAAAMEMTPTAFVRAAVSDFARFAAEEDWASLVSSMRETEEPGTVCLLAMVDWRLTASACGAHSVPHQRKGTGDG